MTTSDRGALATRLAVVVADAYSWGPGWSRRVADAVLATLAEWGQIVTEPCVCDSNPGTTNGPEEHCPRHGRPYSEWVKAAEKAEAEAHDLRTERDQADLALADAKAERDDWKRRARRLAGEAS